MKTIKDFFARFKSEPSFREKYASCRSVDEVRNLASTEGYSFSEAELSEAFALDEDALSDTAGGAYTNLKSSNNWISDWSHSGYKLSWRE